MKINFIIVGLMLYTCVALANDAPLKQVFGTSEYYQLKAQKKSIAVFAHNPMQDTFRVDFAYLDAKAEQIEIQVNEPINTYQIAPVSYQIVGKVKGNTLSFLRQGRDYLVVRINKKHQLILITQQSVAKKYTNLKSVLDFGVSAQSTAIQTKAIQTALEQAAAKRQVLYFPAGIYQATELKIPSHSHIYLEKGAVLYAADHVKHYATYDKNEKIKTDFLFIKDQQNVIIEGNGMVMANGVKLALSVDKPAKKAWRHGEIENVMFRLHALRAENSKNITIKGITVVESTDWAITFFNCDNVNVDAAKVINYSEWFWSDGFHATSCRNVNITNCFAHCGDDAFVTTTRVPNAPSFNIQFKHNVVGFTTCSAFRAGWYAYDSMRHVTFDSNLAISAGRGIDLVHYGYLGFPIKHITFKNTIIEHINDDGGTWQNRCPIFFDMRQQARDTEKGKPGMIENVIVENFKSLTWGVHPSVIKSFDENGFFKNVTFTNVEIGGKKIQNAEVANMKIHELSRNILFKD